MRPASSYLSAIKSEKLFVQYNLAGTTPPQVKARLSINISLDERNRPVALENLKNALAELSGTSSSNIGITAGASQGLFQSLAAVTKIGDTILVESPTYEPFLATARFLGLKVREFKRTGDFKKDLLRIKLGSKQVKAILFSNPNAPTGMIYTSKQISEISRIGPVLIVDEAYLPLFSNGRVSSVSRFRNTISIGSMSKSIGLSVARVGWVITNRTLLNKILNVASVLNVDMATPSLYLSSKVLGDWHLQIKRLISLAEVNRRVVLDFSKKYPGKIPWGFSSGHFFVLRIPSAYSTSREFSRSLRKKSVWVRDCELFGLPQFVRINVLISPRKFRLAMRIIESLYES